MLLTEVGTQKYDIGRAAVFRQPVWDGTTDLFDAFVHIGNTEGAIDIATNPEYSELALETSGPAAIKRYFSGERPEFELGIFPTEAGLALFTPVARGTSGLERRRVVREHTLWIVPEELFLKADLAGNMTEVPITYAGGAFLKDGLALTVEEQRLVDLSLIIWRADFSRSTPLFKHDDGGKSLRSVTVQVKQDFTKPSGAQLYLVMGELADFPAIEPEVPELGAARATIIVLGASYGSFQGFAGFPPYQNVVDLIMQGLPDTAEFILVDAAFPARNLETVLANLDTDVAPYLDPDGPNIMLGYFAATLNDVWTGSSNDINVIKARAAAVKAWADARPEQIFIGIHTETGFPEASAVGWGVIKEQLNTEWRTNLAAYGDFLIDLVDYLPTIEDVDGTGKPTDKYYFQSAGTGNHLMSPAARAWADICLIRAKETVVPGLPLVLPDNFRLVAADTGNPAAFTARAGTRSVTVEAIAMLDGADLAAHPETPRVYRPAFGSDVRDFDDSDQYVALTVNVNRDEQPLGNMKPEGHKTTLYAVNGAGQTEKVACGLDFEHDIPIVFGAGGPTTDTWLLDLDWLFRINSENSGTDLERAQKIMIWDPRQSVVAGPNFTSLHSIHGAAFGHPQFVVTLGTPVWNDVTVGGKTVREIYLPTAGDEVATAYHARMPWGSSFQALCGKFGVSFADGVGGEVVMENAAGENIKMIGGATNIRGSSTVLALAEADLSPATPRVAGGGNSFRRALLTLNGGPSDFTSAGMEIEGHGSRGTANDHYTRLSGNMRLRLKGPLRVRIALAHPFAASGAVDNGRTDAPGYRAQFDTRYGTTTAA